MYANFSCTVCNKLFFKKNKYKQTDCDFGCCAVYKYSHLHTYLHNWIYISVSFTGRPRIWWDAVWIAGVRRLTGMYLWRLRWWSSCSVWWRVWSWWSVCASATRSWVVWHRHLSTYSIYRQQLHWQNEHFMIPSTTNERTNERTHASTHACTHTHTHTHTFNGPFSGTTRVSWYQKGKTNLDFTAARDSEWQWHRWAVCKSAPRSRQITMPAPHHSVYLQARCPSCHPTDKRQSTEGRR